MLWAAAPSFTRYHPSEGVFLQVPSSSVPLTPIGRTPAGRRLPLLWLHIGLLLPLALLFSALWWTRKPTRRSGKSLHRWIGRALAALWLPWVLAGWALQYGASTAAHTPGDETHIYPSSIAWVLLHADLTITNTSANAFYLLEMPRRFGLVLLTSHCVGCVGLLAAMGSLTRCMLSSGGYLWEISFEALTQCLILSVIEATQARAVWRWQASGRLDWVEHHRMSAAWLTVTFFGVPAAFLAHDTTYLWAYPGLGLQGRVLVQVVVAGLTPAMIMRRHLRPIAAYQVSLGAAREQRDAGHSRQRR